MIMKLAILSLALFIAYTYCQSPEACTSPTSCRYTKCVNTTGWSVTCHRTTSRYGFCVCSKNMPVQKCSDRTQCDLTRDCPSSFHSIHCNDGLCTCMNAPIITNLG